MYCFQEKGNPEVNSLLKVFQIISKNYTSIQTIFLHVGTIHHKNYRRLRLLIIEYNQ